MLRNIGVRGKGYKPVLMVYNVLRLCDGGGIEAKIFIPPLNLNRSTND
jgi:hypothetical protein